MRYVLTLVAASGSSEEAVAEAAAELRRLGAECAAPAWLAPGKACDLPFDHPDTEALREAIREVLALRPVDVAMQPVRGRRKRLLIADMESTVIRNEMLDELAEIAGIRPRVAQITARAMNGEIDFEGAIQERVALLQGLPVAALARALEVVDLDPGARPLVRTMGAHGATTALVSGGFGFFAERVREWLGFDVQESNELLIEDGRLSGYLRQPILDRHAKLAILRRQCAALGVTPREVAAVGDGANDLPMLCAAGLGVSYHGKPSVAASAPFRVDHCDLSTLLYFQGYRQSEILDR